MLPGRVFLKPLVQLFLLLLAFSNQLVFHLLYLQDTNLYGLLLNHGLLFTGLVSLVSLISSLGLRCIYV